MYVGNGKTCRDEGRGADKTNTSRHETGHAGTSIPQMNGHFSGIGTGDQIRRGEEVQELFASDPFSPRNDFRFHQRDMCRGSSECRASETQKQKRHLAQTFVLRRIGERFRRVRLFVAQLAFLLAIIASTSRSAKSQSSTGFVFPNPVRCAR